MSLLDCILAGATLFVLLVQAVIGATRPDRIYAFQCWWATSWSMRILGNADKVQQRYSHIPPRRTLIVIQAYSIMTLALSACALFLMIAVGDCGRILITPAEASCQRRNGGTILITKPGGAYIRTLRPWEYPSDRIPHPVSTHRGRRGRDVCGALGVQEERHTDAH